MQTLPPGATVLLKLNTTLSAQKGAASTSLVQMVTRANKRSFLTYFSTFWSMKNTLYKEKEVCFTTSVYM